jgi:hypothetical protein
LQTILLKQPQTFISDALGSGFNPDHPVYNYIGKRIVYWHVWNPPAGFEAVARDIIQGSERRRKRRSFAEKDEQERVGLENEQEGGNVSEGVGAIRGEREAGKESRREGAQQRSASGESREGSSDRKLSPTTQESIARLRACGERLARMGSERCERQAAAQKGNVEGLIPEFNLSLDGIGPEQSSGVGAGIDGMFIREGMVSRDSLKLEARRFGLLGGHEIESRERSSSRASSVSAGSRSKSRER